MAKPIKKAAIQEPTTFQESLCAASAGSLITEPGAMGMRTKIRSSLNGNAAIIWRKGGQKGAQAGKTGRWKKSLGEAVTMRIWMKPWYMPF